MDKTIIYKHIIPELFVLIESDFINSEYVLLILINLVHI